MVEFLLLTFRTLKIIFQKFFSVWIKGLNSSDRKWTFVRHQRMLNRSTSAANVTTAQYIECDEWFPLRFPQNFTSSKQNMFVFSVGHLQFPFISFCDPSYFSPKPSLFSSCSYFLFVSLTLPSHLPRRWESAFRQGEECSSDMLKLTFR